MLYTNAVSAGLRWIMHKNARHWFRKFSSQSRIYIKLDNIELQLCLPNKISTWVLHLVVPSLTEATLFT